MTTAIALLLVLYSLIVIGIGYVAHRRAKAATEEDYFVASRTFGLVVLFLTYEATLYSMWFFTGTGGFWYKHGVGFLCHVLWLTAGGMMLYWIGTRLWLAGKRWGFVTPGDLLAHRYGSEAVRVTAAVVGIGFVFPYVLLQIVGAGRLLHAALDLPLWAGGGLMMLVVITYTLLGGGRAVAWTDAFQGFFFLTLIWAIAIWSVAVLAGGWEPLWSRMAAQMPDRLTLPGPQGTFTFSYWFSFWAVLSVSISMPGIWMRVYSAKGPASLRRTAALVPLGAVVAYLATLLYAFSAAPHFPGLAGTEPDQLLPTMLREFGPGWMLPVVVAAFAAGMSTADSQLLAVSAMVTSDVYKRYVRQGASQGHLVWVGRAFVVAFTALAWLVASFVELPLLVNLGLMAYAGTANLFVPLVGALFWRRATAAGALSGIAAGVATLLLLDPKTSPLFASAPLPLHPGFAGLVVNAAVFTAVSLATPHAGGEQHEAYRRLFRRAYRRT
ncbi:MAG: sodium:solute symporter [Candidatus Brocadiia bacterium]